MDHNTNELIKVVILMTLLFFMGVMYYYIDKKNKKKISQIKVIDPTYSDSIYCHYINGLGIAESDARIEIHTDSLLFKIQNNNYELSYDKLLSINEYTKEQSEYISKIHWGRAIVGGALLGEPGFIVGGMPSNSVKKNYEKQILISYNKDDTVQFITIKGISYNSLFNEVSKYKQISQQNIKL